jgi:hypothetical protein
VADNDEVDVTLALTHDEALVLFEWLHREGVRDRLETLVAHPAELIAIDSFAALLEPELAEPFAENYVELVQAARERLVADGD